MDLTNFTLDQRKAIVSEGSNILVSAGAGSGKTQVLTARVVYFVSEKHYSLDQFLILTFTKLAAGEMKERIRKKLTEEGLLDAANQVDSANICTFDSYALNLVKRYHFILNVSPNVSIIDKTIIDVKKRDIIEDIFERLYKERDEEFCQMIEHFCLKDDKDIRELILKVYDVALLETKTNEYLDNFEEIYYSEGKLEKITDLLLKKMDKLRVELKESIENIPPEIPTKDKLDKANHYAAEIYKFLFKAKTYDEMISAFNNIDPDDHSNFQGSNKDWSEQTKEKVDSFKKAQDSLCKFFKSLPANKVEAFKELSDTKPYSKTIIRIVKELDERLISFKNEKGVYEFSDIAKMASKLVEENEKVREEIKSSLKMIMIDEYQDTSSLQDDFIKQIADHNVYMVGDVKQSIYRFRNADVSIFMKKYSDYKKNGTGQVIDMNKNFRSRREVLDDINYIFEQLMSKDHGGANYRDEHMIQFGNDKYLEAGNKGSDSHMRRLLYEDNGDSKTTEARTIALDIIEKINSGYKVMEIKKEKDKNGKEIETPSLRPVSFSDFCILMDRGGAFDDYQRVFNEMRLPIYVENDKDISSDDIVLVLTNLLRMVDFVLREGFDYKDAHFKKAWLSLARSFVFAYSDEKIYEIFKKGDLAHESITGKIREIVLNNFNSVPYELLEKLIFELDIYSRCIALGEVEANHKYLDYFLEMFKNMSDLGYGISDFISFMENVDDLDLGLKLSSTGTSLDSVRIMNIHKSKGLEFNIVYLSGLYKSFNKTDNNKRYSLSKEFGLIVPKGPHKANIVKIVNNDYESKEDASEKIRQLYVALTRTREQLIVLEKKEEGLNVDEKEIESKKNFIKVNYINYANGTLDYDSFLSLLDKEGFEPTFQFLMMNEEERRKIAIEESIEYFVEKADLIEDVSKLDSFHLMLSAVKDSFKFVSQELPESDETPIIKNLPPKKEHMPLEIKPLSLEYRAEETKRASKKLNLDANRDSLSFGTDLHFLFETTDFINPDFSLMSPYERKIVERFLSNPFMSLVKDGKIYKEYQYEDEENNVKGTIDLMIVYKDHIDVIDYKTKSIDDMSYDKQIGAYMDYVQKTFKKKTNGYLYSLLTGECKTH